MFTKIEDFINNKPSVTESKKSGKDISGFKEVVEIDGIGKLKAKFDTGNTTPYCALIVQDYYEKDGNVKFEVNHTEYNMPVVKHMRVYHHGKSSERPVIKLTLIFNGKKYEDELVDLKIADLTGTENYHCRMLMCKKFIEKANILLDPSADFRLTDAKDIDKPKKKKSNGKQ